MVFWSITGHAGTRDTATPVPHAFCATRAWAIGHAGNAGNPFHSPAGATLSIAVRNVEKRRLGGDANLEAIRRTGKLAQVRSAQAT